MEQLNEAYGRSLRSRRPQAMRRRRARRSSQTSYMCGLGVRRVLARWRSLPGSRPSSSRSPASSPRRLQVLPRSATSSETCTGCICQAPRWQRAQRIRALRSIRGDRASRGASALERRRRVDHHPLAPRLAQPPLVARSQHGLTRSLRVRSVCGQWRSIRLASTVVSAEGNVRSVPGWGASRAPRPLRRRDSPARRAARAFQHPAPPCLGFL